jgi:hypothetical protein
LGYEGWSNYCLVGFLVGEVYKCGSFLMYSDVFLSVEAETALCHLDITEQEQMRHLVANNLKHLIKNQSRNSKNTKYEWNIIKSIKQKLLDNNSIITQADKGKTIVIIHKQEYDQYIDTFINNSNFTRLSKDPTSTYQRFIKDSINKCRMLIPNEQKQKCYNSNPNSSTLHTLIKLHKTPTIIRLIINWKNAPAHKLASFLTKTIGEYITLPNTFNVLNTMNLVSELNTIDINQTPEYVLLTSLICTLTYPYTVIDIIRDTLTKEKYPHTIIRKINTITKLFST